MRGSANGKFPGAIRGRGFLLSQHRILAEARPRQSDIKDGGWGIWSDMEGNQIFVFGEFLQNWLRNLATTGLSRHKDEA